MYKETEDGKSKCQAIAMRGGEFKIYWVCLAGYETFLRLLPRVRWWGIGFASSCSGINKITDEKNIYLYYAGGPHGYSLRRFGGQRGLG